MSNDIPSPEFFAPETTSSDTSAPETTSSDTAASTETAEEKAKRAYTSPRTNFATETLAEIAILRTKWETSEDLSKEDVLSVLDLLTQRVEFLRDHGRDKSDDGGEKRTRSATPNPYQGKHWWLGQNVSGALEVVNCTKRPTPANIGAHVVKLWGPFNTKSGVEYAVSHGVQPHHKVIY